MGRWEPNARGRLERAALELYVERGYEQTPVAEITRRAGLTERTFFRHFADKREVLFAGSGGLEELCVGAVAAAPPAATPMEAVAAALDAAAGVFEERGDLVLQRQGVIDANAELRERELIKLASLAGALADALDRRGVDAMTAQLTAETAIAVLKVAFRRWIDGGREKPLRSLLAECFDVLRSLSARGAAGTP
ncbi:MULTISPECIES: TetR/AcrR family transcriptional regulator [Streptomyces]|uniref:Helix-turn-helix domain-containing protein n=1 Tax=Streptomyces lienomycini TaxID=284035 RepID=A0ABV9WLD0_9ACTN|nr:MULTISPECIES: TetR/AcrR family transcriptional regulator [Streptomyces]